MGRERKRVVGIMEKGHFVKLIILFGGVWHLSNGMTQESSDVLDSKRAINENKHCF